MKADALQYSHHFRRALLILITLAASIGIVRVEAQGPLRASQDGIVVSARVASNKVMVDWRFAQPLAAGLKEFTATRSGRPVGTVTRVGYPWLDAATAALVLLDTTNEAMRTRIDVDKVSIIQVLRSAGAHHAPAVARASTNLDLIEATDPGRLANEIASALPLRVALNLQRTLQEALILVSSVEADRRAVFFFLGGQFVEPDDLPGIVALAHRLDIAVSFILPESSGPPRAALSQIAEGSGGQVISGEARASFLANPFTFIDSGGRFSVDISNLTRKYWEPDVPIDIRLEYGEKALTMKVDAPVRQLSLPSSLRATASENPLALGLLVGGVAAISGLVLFALRRRPPPSPRKVARPKLRRPMLEDLTDGTLHEVVAPETRIGRADDNHIVIDHDTVSRQHASLTVDHNGELHLSDQSETNPTLVNHLVVREAKLEDGDLISFGSKTFQVLLPVRQRKTG